MEVVLTWFVSMTALRHDKLCINVEIYQHCVVSSYTKPKFGVVLKASMANPVKVLQLYRRMEVEIRGSFFWKMLCCR